MRARLTVIGVVVVGLIFLGSSLCLANGGAPVTKGVAKEPAGKVEQFPVSQMTSAKGAYLKSPGLATLLSVLCPGLGQIYNEDNITKVLIMGSLEGLCWVMIGAADMDGVGIFGLAMGRVVSGVDAYYTAIEKNRGLSFRIDNEKVLVAIKGYF